MKKTFVITFVIMLHLNTAISLETAYCISPKDDEIKCQYGSSSDLSIFDTPPKLHNIQRFFINSETSVALVRSATINELNFSSCWTLYKPYEKYVFCSQAIGFADLIPAEIVERMRK
jgi:hypothetical protein